MTFYEPEAQFCPKPLEIISNTFFSAARGSEKMIFGVIPIEILIFSIRKFWKSEHLKIRDVKTRGFLGPTIGLNYLKFSGTEA